MFLNYHIKRLPSKVQKIIIFFVLFLSLCLLNPKASSKPLEIFETEVEFNGETEVIQFSSKEDLTLQAERILRLKSVVGNLTHLTRVVVKKFESILAQQWMKDGKRFEKRRNNVEDCLISTFDLESSHNLDTSWMGHVMNKFESASCLISSTKLFYSYIRDTSTTLDCIEFSSSDYIGYDIVGLTTYPNSGTGWTLKVVRDATGIRHNVLEIGVDEHGDMSVMLPRYDNSVVDEEFGMFPTRSRENKEPLFTYTHSLYPSTAYAGFSRIIRIVRNPIDNIWANWRWMNGNSSGFFIGHKLQKTKISGELHEFKSFSIPQLEMYFLWHCSIDLISQKMPVLTISYEDLLARPVPMFKKIISFIGYKLPDDNHLQQVIQQYQPIYQPGFQHIKKYLDPRLDNGTYEGKFLQQLVSKINSEVKMKYIRRQCNISQTRSVEMQQFLMKYTILNSHLFAMADHDSAHLSN